MVHRTFDRLKKRSGSQERDPYQGRRPAGRGRPLSLLLSLLVLVGLPGIASAQQQVGNITGTVTDATTGAPLTEVQIFLPGTGFGGLTRENGRFIILNVPAGAHQVRAERIGMESATQQVTVTAGQATEVNFQLSSQALGLDEIVVTGTAGAARRREVGNSIAQVNVADVKEPIANVDNLLSAQAPGMTVMRTGSALGSGAQIRLRGNVSVAMSNQPLIYIDGVRIRSDGMEKNYAVGDHILFSNNDVIGPLNDLNPSDIERIEVVKGPAATALYGTEAAGGVIQIFTKKGQSGAPVWNLQVDQGGAWVEKFGPSNAPYMRMDPWLRTGHNQRYAASVRGGASALTYYLSGTLEDNIGVLPNDHEKKKSLRSNFGFQPLPGVTVEWNTNISREHLNSTTMGGNPYSLMLNAYRAPPGRPGNYIGSADVADLTRLLEYKILTEMDRVVSGLTATWAPSSNLSNRVTFGMDRISSDLYNERPFNYINAPQGDISDEVWVNRVLTADYLGTLDFNITSSLDSRLSWGGQWVDNDERSVASRGDGLPGPGETTVESAAHTYGYQKRQRVVNGGFFLQDLLSLKDRYFLTVGARVDGNSAFGQNFGLQVYPRASVSYVLSDEAFWPASLGTVKLRAAFGDAGRAPGAFDAVRTWQPHGWLGGTGFLPQNVGNPDLGPERTVEIEGGFDASLLADRLTVNFSYYNQKTEDALFQVQQIPSNGFGGNQLENVGKISNSGIELGVNGSIVRSRDWTWDVGVNLYTNKSKVVSLGGAAPFSTGGGWIEEGGPVPAVRAPKVMNADEHAEPIIDQNYVWGPNQPTRTIQANTTVGLPGGITVSARGEYMGGNYIQDGALAGSVSRGATTPFCDAVFPDLQKGIRDPYTARQRSWCDPKIQGASEVYPADFFRVRDVSLQLPVPFQIPRATRATLSVSAQNFWSWKNKDFLAMDPELAGSQGINSGLARSMDYQVPPPATFLVSLRLVF